MQKKSKGVTGKFSLWVQNKAGQRLTEFCQENTQVIVNTSFQGTQASTPHGSQDSCVQCPWPHSRPLLTHTSTETPGYSQANLAQSLVVSLLLSSGSWCTQGFVWALQVSLVDMGFDSKCDFTLPTIFLGLLLCPWTWGIFFWWDQTFSCPWLLSCKF